MYDSKDLAGASVWLMTAQTWTQYIDFFFSQLMYICSIHMTLGLKPLMMDPPQLLFVPSLRMIRAN